MYWAQGLAQQSDDAELAAQFAPLAATLAENETKIIDELAAAQGQPAQLGGYYHADRNTVKKIMRSSPTLNKILADASH
jgi:isocitrate dehydrogenase